jgi:hypothetical protein
MKGKTLQVRNLRGMDESLPQGIDSATLIENFTVDKRSKALSSRVGYEKYRPSIASAFTPFGALGRIDSLFVLNQSPGGARQSILFESGGALYLFYEVGQQNVLVNLIARTKPTSTESASVYAQFGDRVIITNGHDAPIVVRPWPLPLNASISAQVKQQIVRPLGFSGLPTSPEALKVAPLHGVGTASSTDSYTGGSTTNWYPVYGNSVSFPGAFGMGASYGGYGAGDVGAGTPPDSNPEGVENSFSFRVAFISDTGSVSPLSVPAESTWTILESQDGFRYCPTITLPIGPPGTLARRVYSTTNGGSLFYLVADVRNNIEELFHCYRRENSYTITAPSESESGVFPGSRARVCASFKGCLFLDGGAEDGTRLYFSAPGLPDQFGSANYINLTSGGGSITGLYAYYNNLILFRENSIDVLTGNYPDFTVQTVTKQVSCRAPNSADSVPGLGVVFLANDGIYALSGGLDGGAVFEVRPIGAQIRNTTERITLECIARSVGRYSLRDRAYHLYIPVDGSDRPNLGCIYHIERRGPGTVDASGAPIPPPPIGWSVRTGFPVGCIDRTYNGALLFGHSDGAEAGADKPAGLFVITPTRAMGGTIVDDVYTVGDPPASIYESCWHDFGDAQSKKQVQYVTVWAQTTGSVTVTLKHYKDFEPTAVGTNSRYVYQPPDTASQPVYDTALVGTTAWQESRLVPLRIPVAQQSCSWFKFRIETTDDILLVAYELEFRARGTQVVAGKLA